MQDNEIGFIIKLISDSEERFINSVVKEFGVTMSQVRVLLFIRRCGGIVTQREIESHLNVAHPTVVGLISRMKEKGLLETLDGEGKKRAKTVAMTEKADEIYARLDAAKLNVENNLLAGMTEEETEALKKLLQKLYCNLAKGTEGTDG